MPKAALSLQSKFHKWTAGHEDLKTDGSIIYCKICDKTIACAKKFQVEQHLSTSMHKINKKKQPTKHQSLLTQRGESSSKNVFYSDLCKAMVSSNIPWNKLNNPNFKGFLEKYCKQSVPDESTLRKGYLNDLYNSTIECIQEKIGENYVWFAVDETTDTCGRYVANFVIGKLSNEDAGHPYILTSKVLAQTNGNTIARFVNESFRLLWPNIGHENRVLLMLSDSAAYMHKAAQHLQVFYPHLVHNTCFAHSLHRVAEEIRHQFDRVNCLISSVKKIFLKSPMRIGQYRESLRNVPLPPEPILTRWGTWLNAALFYADHFDGIKHVTASFNTETSRYVLLAQELFSDSSIHRDLNMLKTYYSELPNRINQLESRSLTLNMSLIHMKKAIEEIKMVPGPVGKCIAEKLDRVLQRNPGYKILCEIDEYITGNSTVLPENLSPAHASFYKFSPVTSVDVERSFSAYKLILSDKRHSLTHTHMEQLLVIYCYNNYGC